MTGDDERAALLVVRRYGEIEPDLPRKLQRNIRRNVGITVPRDAIVACARHYKQVYGLASRLLPRYQRPPRGRYVDAADVRLVGLRGALKRRYLASRSA